MDVYVVLNPCHVTILSHQDIGNRYKQEASGVSNLNFTFHLYGFYVSPAISSKLPEEEGGGGFIKSGRLFGAALSPYPHGI